MVGRTECANDQVQIGRIIYQYSWKDNSFIFNYLYIFINWWTPCNPKGEGRPFLLGSPAVRAFDRPCWSPGTAECRISKTWWAMEGSTCFLRSLNPLRGIQLHSVRVILSLSLSRALGSLWYDLVCVSVDHINLGCFQFDDWSNCVLKAHYIGNHPCQHQSWADLQESGLQILDFDGQQKSNCSCRVYRPPNR